MDKSPVFIINFNRLTLPSRMADYLADCPGVYPVIVDNASTYPPLLEYYETTPHKVKRLSGNWCSTVIFFCGILEEYGITERFILTDPDLILDSIPKDFLHLLHLGLDKYPWAQKAGFSLEINDLPDTEITRAAKAHEESYWSEKLDDQFYRAQIDTTFCMVRKIHDMPAVRTARPYTAKHAPWYYTDKDTLPDDELYYLQTASSDSTYWARLMAKEFDIK
jgi:hypothetical protein